MTRRLRGRCAAQRLALFWHHFRGPAEPEPWVLMKNTLNYRVAKRVVIVVIGGTVTLIGIALIVLPGPAFIVIPIGLSILATEFLWAKRWLQKARELATPGKSKRTRDD